jgi:uncharacterized protein (DUF2267 family)
METTNHTNEVKPLEEEEVYFLQQIRKELSLDSTHEAVRLVAGVLQGLRQTLSLEHAQDMLNQLPDFLKLAFAANWERDEPTIQIKHLDEFVCLVMDRDERTRKGLFKNEVQTLTVIILTLKKLQKIVDIETFEGISPVLRQELRDVSSEAA